MRHEWIEVLNRRWCVCCSAFQQRKSASEPWRETKYPCANDTPYAHNKNAISIEPLSDNDGVRRAYRDPPIEPWPTGREAQGND